MPVTCEGAFDGDVRDDLYLVLFVARLGHLDLMVAAGPGGNPGSYRDPPLYECGRVLAASPLPIGSQVRWEGDPDFDSPPNPTSFDQ